MGKHTKTLLWVLSVVMAFGLGTCSPAEDRVGVAEDSVLQPAPPPALPAYLPGQKSQVHLTMEKGQCSGVVVGKRTLLTATHCFEGGDKLTEVDHVAVNARIIANDGKDHVLVQLDADVLDGYRAAPIAGGIPAPGTDLYFWGSPAGLEEVLRKGYVAGVWRDLDGTDYILMDFNTWHGDSGGAFFNANGEVVTVLYGSYRVKYPSQWDMTIVQPLAFTPGQLSLIK